jgi:hypothetical protein
MLDKYILIILRKILFYKNSTKLIFFSKYGRKFPQKLSKLYFLDIAE